MLKDNTFIYTDYVVPDRKESKLRTKLSGVPLGTPEYSKLHKELDTTMIENRGIKFGEKGKVFIDYLTFSKYIIIRMKLVKVQESYYIYNLKKHCYESISLDSIASFIMKIMGEYDESYYQVSMESELLILISRQIKNMKSLIETTGFIILKNGTYKICDHSFKSAFNRNIFALSSLAFNFDFEANCPKFLAFLNDIFDGNQGMIKLMQQIFGYTFAYGDVKMHKLFYFYGFGRNGKGVLAKILTDLHGEQNVSAVFLDELANRFSTSNLVGKVVNISPEGKQSQILDTSMIKSLTAGDTIMIEKKYQNAYPAKLSTKFIVLSNYTLRTEDDSFGFQQRIVPIPFRKQYCELPYDGIRQEGVCYQDPDLYDKLKLELPGIFNWALEGLKDLQDHNWVLTECKDVMELRQQFTLQNKPVRLFFKSCFEVGCDDDYIKSSEITQAFHKWSHINNIPSLGFNKPAEFHQEFRRVLEQENLNVVTKKRKGYDYYYGFRLKADYTEHVYF